MRLFDGLFDGHVLVDGLLAFAWGRDHQDAVRAEVGDDVVGVGVLGQGPLARELLHDGAGSEGRRVARVLAVFGAPRVCPRC